MDEETAAEVRARIIAEWTADWQHLEFRSGDHPNPESDYNIGCAFVESTPEADDDLDQRLRDAGVI